MVSYYSANKIEQCGTQMPHQNAGALNAPEGSILVAVYEDGAKKKAVDISDPGTAQFLEGMHKDNRYVWTGTYAVPKANLGECIGTAEGEDFSYEEMLARRRAAMFANLKPKSRQ